MTTDGTFSYLKSLSPHDKLEQTTKLFISRIQNEEPIEWIPDFTKAVEAGETDLRSIRLALGNLAWLGREQSLPNGTEIANDTLKASERLYLAYYAGERLRYDFRFQQLGTQVMDWRKEFPNDSLLMAFGAFRRLGTRDHYGVKLYEYCLEAPDVDDRVESVCLHAMWFATWLKDQPDRLLELSDRLVTQHEANHVFHYRRAFALRRQSRFDEALDAIDGALARLNVGNDSINIHQDYVRERELIVTSQLIEAQVQRLTESAEDKIRVTVEARMQEAQAMVSDSLLRLVEILGIFVTLVGFLGASGLALFQATEWWQATLSVTSAGLISLGFFLTLRYVIGSKYR